MEEQIHSVLKIILTHLTLLLHHTLHQLELLKLIKILVFANSQIHLKVALDNVVQAEVMKRLFHTTKLTSLQEEVSHLLHQHLLIKKLQLPLTLHQEYHFHQVVTTMLKAEVSLIWLLLVQTYSFQPKEQLKELEELLAHHQLLQELLLFSMTMSSLKLESH